MGQGNGGVESFAGQQKTQRAADGDTATKHQHFLTRKGDSIAA